MTSANMAPSTSTSMMTAPAAPSGWRQKKNRSRPNVPPAPAPARASSAAKSATSTPCFPAATGLVRVLDARIERRVEHVDQEVHDHDDDGDEHDEVLHDRIVARADRLDEEAGDARDVEHCL